MTKKKASDRLHQIQEPATAQVAQRWCETMDRPAASCGCPDCGSSLIDFPAQAAQPAAPLALPVPDVLLCAVEDRLEPVVRKTVGASPGRPLDLFTADTVRALLATATGLPAQAGVNRYCSAGMCVSSDTEHDPKCTAAPQALDDSALLDAMERQRIAVVPEYEGPWDAEIYNDEGQPNHHGTGSTPREAIRAAIATQTAAQGEQQ